MREATLWLLGLMACLPVCSLAALQVLAAPNKLRLETPENIFVECQDCSGPGPITVTINVLIYPTKARLLTSNKVILTKDDNYQKLEQIMIPAEDFKKDPNLKQYVYLQAQFPGGLVVEKVVMVSFQSGFIFIQTDKTIYTPDSRVQYRLFAVTPGMDPIETDAGGYVNVEIENPQGLSLSLTEGVLIKGIKSGKYQIPKIASLGVWKVVASFINNPQETFSANFEVKEYVLPSIEVKLVPVKSFFYVNSATFEVNIEAKYLYGKAVDGEAYVVFGVIHDNEKMSFPHSFKRVPLIHGGGKATLEMQHITHIFPEINELVGSAIYVTVSVLTASGSDMVEAEKRGIHIVTSPYKIDLKKTPKYFKPGMPLDVSIHVMNPDNTPAPNVPVMLIVGTKRQNVITDLNGNGKSPFNIEETQTSNMNITAETTLDLTEGSQSRATMTVQPYQSRSQNHLHIGVETSGNSIVVTFNSGNPAMSAMAAYDITYLILSKGRILDVGRLRRSVGQTVMKITLPVTKAMLPSFRLIAYYHVSTTEVVSDSVLVDVKDTCMGSLKIESHPGDTSYEPGDTLRLKVTGDPGARVGLVAVDKAVYVLNNKHRLTQKKVWGIMERYDTGCTPGGGKDSMGVFYDAGLLFATTNNETLDRTDPNCPVSTRRKRSVTIGDVKTTLVRQYSDEWQRKCCLDGMKNTPLSYDCQRRSEYITENQTCVDAFMNCCTQLANQREASKKQEELYLARSEDMKDIDRYANDITSRTDFPESWLWIEIDLPDLPNCAQNSKCIYLDKDGGGEKLRDSITTWEISGISLSNSYGICVSEPLEVIVKKKFFIDLRLPYSAVQGEQLEIKAILHNLGNDKEPLEVYLDLIDNVDVCSLASKSRKYRQKVVIRGTTMAVPFNIIPMKEGRHRIEVKAIVPKYYGGDGIVKELLVMPMGVLTRHTEERTLKPAEHGGTLTRHIENNFNKTDMVPSTPTYTNISITAHHLSALLESALSGTAMETLIRKPSGCGEQRMFKMTALVIATTYLDKTQKWEDVGFIKKRNEALEHILSGYTDHLGYRRAEGCFVFYQDNKCSTWLTAYTVKVFAMVNQFVEVKSGVLCGAVKWLFQNAWNPDGSFQELGTALTSQTYLTAFTLISIQELESDCAKYISSLPSKINKTVAYLKNNLRTLKNNPYAVAMTSYALANANQLDREILFNSSSGGNHWLAPGDVHQWGRWGYSNRATSLTLEATGYALLALLKAKAFQDAKPIVSWLNQRRDYYGGYGSTQATMVVYQALAEYWSIVPEDPFDLDVEIKIVGRSRKLPTWKFTRENSFATRSTQVNRIEALDVTAKGTGEVTISVMSLYYAQPKMDGLMDNCEKFNLTVTLNLVKTDEAGDIYMLEMNFRNKVKDNDATMTILDIGLPTGFVADHSQLESLSTGVDRTISKYEIDSLLSETKKDKGSIIMYLDKVSNAKTEQIRFNIIKKMKVGNLQPAAVSMYEYYNEKSCVKFYHPETENRQIQTICRSDSNVCLCAEENCSKQKKDKVTDETRNIERFNMACRKEDNNQTEYVYKVRVVDVQPGKSADVYRMCIEKPIKEGADIGVEWRLRTFLSLPQCRDSLGLEKNKTYLIMGMKDDLHKNDKYEYVIGERTWVEYWPSPAECKARGSEHRRVCNVLKKLISDLDIIGCPDA